MGGALCIMKLARLTVNRLYGCYDYDVTFNQDVTFLYGENGCGKTTILNITEAIITGQLYKLFDFQFKKIILQYSKMPSYQNDIKNITINSHKEKISVIFNDKSYEIERLINEEHRSDKDQRERVRYYFNKYEFLSKIKETFNYVYLPLNRSSTQYDYDDYYFIMRSFRNHNAYEPDDYFNSEANDIAMSQIESLINYNYSKINSTVSKYNDDFRNEMLKSLLE